MFLALTLLVAAPIMCFGGIFMALRQDVELSGLLLLVMPALIISIGLVIRQMRPLFRVMQTKIDAINGIMREQIMGIRVIRAFVKERYEAERFGDANRETMEVAIAVGRLTVDDVPDRHADHERVGRPGHVVRRLPHRQRRTARSAR